MYYKNLNPLNVNIDLSGNGQVYDCTDTHFFVDVV